jgi:hypothetical protein
LQRALNNYILKPKKDSIERWRKEMEMKIRSDALLAIHKDSISGGMSAISSAKWLAEGRYKLKPTTNKAREDVVAPAEQVSKEPDVYAEDIQRMAQYSIDNAIIQ